MTDTPEWMDPRVKAITDLAKEAPEDSVIVVSQEDYDLFLFTISMGMCLSTIARHGYLNTLANNADGETVVPVIAVSDVQEPATMTLAEFMEAYPKEVAE